MVTSLWVVGRVLACHLASEAIEISCCEREPMTRFFHGRKGSKSSRVSEPITTKRTSITHHIHGLAAAMAMAKPRTFLHKIIKSFGASSGREALEEDLEQIAAQERKRFSLDVLVNATDDFHSSNKLGQGGFGPVYKGYLPDGRVVAVKKLALDSKQGSKEFRNEAELLVRVQHRNIVSLLGYCASSTENLLVYEYVPNQSLDKFIFVSKRKHELDWKRRFDIISGIARGLHYLHDESHSCIIHRDIKASNILLDDKWLPKIADFGMARIFPEDQTHVNTRIVGTNGYMAPEYLRHGKLTVKADVFSFGVVVIELITGHRNSSFDMDPDSHSLLEWVFKCYKKRRCAEIMDTSLESSAIPEQVQHCVQVGLLCTQRDPALRPNMNRVIVMLSKKPGSLEEPSQPGYPGLRYKPHKSRMTSSTTGKSSYPSSSHSFGSTSNTTISTATMSADTKPIVDPRGKQPMDSPYWQNEWVG